MVANSHSDHRAWVAGLRLPACSERSHIFAPNNSHHLLLTAHDGKLFT